MKKKLNEGTIRDNLAESLSIISPDLTLLQKEYYLPHISGTRGFIDILAKDEKNKYVIIEIKRSGEASRETLHEILKYVEALKENKKVNESEIRVIVVSTEWKELLVPFSSFINRVKFSVEGFILTVDENFSPKFCQTVSPLKLKNERLFSPIHCINLYSNIENLERGIKSHVEVFKNKEINDYILIIMLASDSFQEYSHAQLNKISNALGIDIDLEEIPYQPYMIYSVFTRLSESQYIDVISKSQETYDELLYEIKSVELEEKKLSIYEDYLIYNLEPFPFSEHTEISYPAKFACKLIEDEEWIIDKVLIFGALRDNELLEDSIVIAEISGGQGSDGLMFKSNLESNNFSKLEEIKAGVKRVFHDNKVWLNHINCILQYYVEKNKSFELYIEAYSPHNILLSIYRQLNEENGNIWLPTYKMSFSFPNTSVKKLYIGVLVWDGTQPSMTNIINKYYSGDPSNLTLPIIWGGYEDKDFSIMKDLGLHFGSILYEAHSKEEIFTFKFENFEFVKTESFNYAYNDFLLFVKENTEFISTLINLINSHVVA